MSSSSLGRFSSWAWAPTAKSIAAAKAPTATKRVIFPTSNVAARIQDNLGRLRNGRDGRGMKKTWTPQGLKAFVQWPIQGRRRAVRDGSGGIVAKL
jgi:hypothetical protein